MNKNNKEKMLNIRIDREIETELKTIAKLECKTVSEIVRIYLRREIFNYFYNERELLR